MRASFAAAFALASMLAQACKQPAPYVGWSTSSLEFTAAEVQPTGITFGVGSGTAAQGGAFGELRVREDDSEEFELTEIVGGYRGVLRDTSILRIGYGVDLGAGFADLARFANDNDLLSLGAALTLESRLGGPVSFFANAGYRQYFDLTSPTTCNDGSTSNSVGSGTCSHHGGIDHYNDQLGDGGGLEILIGIRFSPPPSPSEQP